VVLLALCCNGFGGGGGGGGGGGVLSELAISGRKADNSSDGLPVPARADLATSRPFLELCG